VLDAFSGSAVVAYMYKTKGLQVIANDRLRYCHHAAKAIIENNSVRLSEDEIEALLADNAKAGSFVQDNFKGIFFAKGVHALIDTIRANCDKLSGFKKDIALFGLGKTCMSGKGGFGHFSSSTDYGRRQDTPTSSRIVCARTCSASTPWSSTTTRRTRRTGRTSTTCCRKPRRIWPTSTRLTPPSFRPPTTSGPTTSWRGS
jgi:Adenine-specific DNA methylase